jgi:hypothetical protein
MVLPPGKARRMSPWSWRLHPGAGAQSAVASPPGEPRQAAGADFLGGGDARPVRHTAQNPFRDVMATRGVCCKGRTPHPMVNIGRAEGRAAVAGLLILEIYM